MCVYVCERVGLRKHHSEVYGRRLYLVNNRMKTELGYLPAAAAAAAPPPRIVVHNPVVPNDGRYLWPLKCCGLRPQRTMTAEGRNEGLCDLSNVVAFGHNEQWRPMAAKVATKLIRISPVGNAVIIVYWQDQRSVANLVTTSVTSQLLWPSATTNYGGRKEGLCDFSYVVAFGHNELWRPGSSKIDY